jgi:hypothetical protein
MLVGVYFRAISQLSLDCHRGTGLAFAVAAVYRWAWWPKSSRSRRRCRPGDGSDLRRR